MIHAETEPIKDLESASLRTRLWLRGPLGARDEFHHATIAQNLRKLAKLCPFKAAIPTI